MNGQVVGSFITHSFSQIVDNFIPHSNNPIHVPPMYRQNVSPTKHGVDKAHNRPQSTSKSEVFPAPFGPTRPRTSWLSKCRPTSTKTGRPPKDIPILKERALQNAGTLSGGQQQQLAIGHVMIGKPRLMLLDKPSEAFNPQSSIVNRQSSIVKDIARNIKRLNKEINLAVLFVEQNLDMIIALAQRCYVMDKGRIIGELDIEEIHDHEKIRRYLAI